MTYLSGPPGVIAQFILANAGVRLSIAADPCSILRHPVQPLRARAAPPPAPERR